MSEARPPLDAGMEAGQARPPDGETGFGGGGREFPSTCWSRILASGDDGPPDRRAVEELAGRYWKPLYCFIRSAWARSNEDAKDLTQDFFTWMIETGFLAKADPARGRFRSFVKASLRNYLGMDERRRHAQKRGGDRPVLAIDRLPGDIPEEWTADRTTPDPEAILDRAWRMELFVQAVDRLETELRGEGREKSFSVFQDYCLEESTDKDYRQVAAKHGITEADVANRLRLAKDRFRDILSSLVAETVGSEEDLREELRSLFGDAP